MCERLRGFKSQKTLGLKAFHIVGEPYLDRSRIYSISPNLNSLELTALPSGSTFTSLSDSDPLQAYLQDRERTHPKFTNASPFSSEIPTTVVGTLTVWILIEQSNAGSQFELAIH